MPDIDKTVELLRRTYFTPHTEKVVSFTEVADFSELRLRENFPDAARDLDAILEGRDSVIAALVAVIEGEIKSPGLIQFRWTHPSSPVPAIASHKES